MEVCPPAETCRDAFERMSRATVRMGSKGFASQTVGGGSLTASAKSLSSTTNPNRAAPQSVQLAPVQRAQRPTRRPTFDMDLSDLYQSPPANRFSSILLLGNGPTSLHNPNNINRTLDILRHILDMTRVLNSSSNSIWSNHPKVPDQQHHLLSHRPHTRSSNNIV